MLQRDLDREQRSAREAEIAAIATRTRSKSTSESPTTRKVPLPPLDSDVLMGPPALPAQTSPPGPVNPARRGSTISLSSLHRPPFPLKLDLSSSSLRLSAEEAALFSQSLPSPVSLAPKSARPSAQAEMELMAAFASAAAGSSSQHVEIDLTGDEDHPMPPIDASLGNSADKPIELDLESIDMEMSTMTDLFGDATESGSGQDSNGVDGIFSPIAPDVSSSNAAKESGEGVLNMEILSVLSAVDNNNHSDHVFGAPDASALQSGQHSSLGAQSAPPSNVAPSPSAILATFSAAQQDSSSQLASGDSNFDLSNLDLSNFDPSFFHQPPDMNLMDMEALLNMGQNGGSSDESKPIS